MHRIASHNSGCKDDFCLSESSIVSLRMLVNEFCLVRCGEGQQGRSGQHRTVSAGVDRDEAAESYFICDFIPPKSWTLTYVTHPKPTCLAWAV